MRSRVLLYGNYSECVEVTLLRVFVEFVAENYKR